MTNDRIDPLGSASRRRARNRQRLFFWVSAGVIALAIVAVIASIFSL